jgi:hypothetical protein
MLAINEKLRDLNPVDADIAMSVQSNAPISGQMELTLKNIGGLPSKDRLSGMNDSQSNFSIPVSGISRRSNFTTITLES